MTTEERSSLTGPELDIYVAGTTLMLFVPLGYSLYVLTAQGLQTEFYLYTYIPLVGSLASIGGTWSFAIVMKLEPRRSLALALATWAGFFPYVFALYLFFFFGLWRLWLGINHPAVRPFLVGIFWVFLGHRILYRTWVLSEIGVATTKRPSASA